MLEYITVAPVASFIFAITIACSILAFSNDSIYGKFILHPYSVARKQNLFTLITSGLIHADWMHLAFNMFSFFAFAFQLEVYIGHWQFAVLYLASLILSDLPTVAKHKDHYQYHSLGASGAVSAVIFGYILYSPFSTLRIVPIPIDIPAVVFGVLYLVYCHFASKHSRDNINHDAHMYGALSGLFLTAILHPEVLQTFIQQIRAVTG